eukprot:s607_g2.t6
MFRLLRPRLRHVLAARGYSAAVGNVSPMPSDRRQGAIVLAPMVACLGSGAVAAVATRSVQHAARFRLPAVLHELTALPLSILLAFRQPRPDSAVGSLSSLGQSTVSRATSATSCERCPMSTQLRQRLQEIAGDIEAMSMCVANNQQAPDTASKMAKSQAHEHERRILGLLDAACGVMEQQLAQGNEPHPANDLKEWEPVDAHLHELDKESLAKALDPTLCLFDLIFRRIHEGTGFCLGPVYSPELASSLYQRATDLLKSFRLCEMVVDQQSPAPFAVHMRRLVTSGHRRGLGAEGSILLAFCISFPFTIVGHVGPLSLFLLQSVLSFSFLGIEFAATLTKKKKKDKEVPKEGGENPSGKKEKKKKRKPAASRSQDGQEAPVQLKPREVAEQERKEASDGEREEPERKKKKKTKTPKAEACVEEEPEKKKKKKHKTERHKDREPPPEEPAPPEEEPVKRKKKKHKADVLDREEEAAPPEHEAPRRRKKVPLEEPAEGKKPRRKKEPRLRAWPEDAEDDQEEPEEEPEEREGRPHRRRRKRRAEREASEERDSPSPPQRRKRRKDGSQERPDRRRRSKSPNEPRSAAQRAWELAKAGGGPAGRAFLRDGVPAKGAPIMPGGHLGARSLGGDAEQVQILLARGAAKDLRDREGRTALHFAAAPGVARALLRALADVNAVADDGTRPLHSSVVSGRRHVLGLLIAAAADVHARLAPRRRLEVYLERPSIHQVWGFRWEQKALKAQRRVVEAVLPQTPAGDWNIAQTASGGEALQEGAELLQLDDLGGCDATQALRGARKAKQLG